MTYKNNNIPSEVATVNSAILGEELRKIHSDKLISTISP